MPTLVPSTANRSTLQTHPVVFAGTFCTFPQFRNRYWRSGWRCSRSGHWHSECGRSSTYGQLQGSHCILPENYIITYMRTIHLSFRHWLGYFCVRSNLSSENLPPLLFFLSNFRTNSLLHLFTQPSKLSTTNFWILPPSNTVCNPSVGPPPNRRNSAAAGLWFLRFPGYTPLLPG